MVFQRTREAPMDFEYERPPHFTYNVFDSCNNAAHADLAEKAAHSVTTNFYVPTSRFSKKDPPEISHVSTKLDDITLDDPAPSAACPATPPLEDTDHSQSALSPPHLPQTPPEIPIAPAPPASGADLSVFQPQRPSQQPILHQHIYPAHASQEDSRDNWIILATGMLHVGCQIALFTLAVYVVVQFALALRRDVTQRMDTYESDILDEHYHCRMEYAKNRCDPSTRLPAMDDLCRQWQQCLYRPIWVGKTRVLAETLADIINGFFDTISFKTMMFVFGITFGMLWSRSTAAAAAAAPRSSGAALDGSSTRKQIRWSPE